MGLGMEPRDSDGEVRERRVQLHMPETDTPLSNLHVHTQHVPVAPAAGFSPRVLFSDLLKPDTRLKCLYRTEKQQTTQTSSPCSPNRESKRQQGTCRRELGLSDPLAPHFNPSLPAPGCQALPHFSCCYPHLLAVSLSAAPNMNCPHTGWHLAVFCIPVVFFFLFFLNPCFLLSHDLSVNMGSCK